MHSCEGVYDTRGHAGEGVNGALSREDAVFVGLLRRAPRPPPPPASAGVRGGGAARCRAGATWRWRALAEEGAQTLVRSICRDDLDPPVDDLARALAARLDARRP